VYLRLYICANTRQDILHRDNFYAKTAKLHYAISAAGRSKQETHQLQEIQPNAEIAIRTLDDPIQCFMHYFIFLFVFKLNLI
jgi:hypothetical protein